MSDLASRIQKARQEAQQMKEQVKRNRALMADMKCTDCDICFAVSVHLFADTLDGCW
jgi:hypothetical protein